MTIPQALIKGQANWEPERLGGARPSQQPFGPPQNYLQTFCSGTMAATGQSDRTEVRAGTSVVAGPAVVGAGELWLYQAPVPQLGQAPWSRSPWEIARASVERGLDHMTRLPQGRLTQPTLRVAWGEVAQMIGLIDQLKQVAIPQKEVVHTAPAKLYGSVT